MQTDRLFSGRINERQLFPIGLQTVNPSENRAEGLRLFVLPLGLWAVSDHPHESWFEFSPRLVGVLWRLSSGSAGITPSFNGPHQRLFLRRSPSCSCFCLQGRLDAHACLIWVWWKIAAEKHTADSDPGKTPPDGPRRWLKAAACVIGGRAEQSQS